MTSNEDVALFDNMVSRFRVRVACYIKEFFGERCKDFEEHCECCKRWKLFDELIENPFLESNKREPANHYKGMLDEYSKSTCDTPRPVRLTTED